MHTKCATKIKINKVEIGFTNKKITACGGFSLLAGFFEKIKLRENAEGIIPVNEISPNGTSVQDRI